ncbi:uncharacterized protein [Amphiura filiformis]|uniref:uncharacterized protein isoform X2 n=1 Tax=Amphiura filiformis TaxID=82378 RepID=UPI003B20E5EA
MDEPTQPMSEKEREVQVQQMHLDTDPETGLNSEPPPPAYGASMAGSPTSEETAPPPYDESSKDAPPSYQSLYGQIKDAKKTSSGPLEFVKKLITLLLNTIVVTIMMGILLAIPITMIVMGALHLHDCPIENKIPIYLLVSGCFYILKTLVDLIVRFKRHRDNEDQEDANGNTKENSFSRLIGCFLFGFFIAGNVWIYSNYPPSDVVGDPNYCYPPMYYFAFWITTAVYIMCAAACCCVCCAAAGTAATTE